MGFDGTSRGVAGRENRCRRGWCERPGKTFSGAGFGRERNYTIFAAINRPAILPGSNKLYMKDFFSILRRFVPPYKYYLVLNIFFNILASILTLFSFALIKQPAATLPFFERRNADGRPRLDAWTHNKSLQKARESRRITPEQKAYLQALKVRVR